MKKIPIFLLLSLMHVSLFSQIDFEKGYIIDNNNQRTDCLIKNKDWKNNPQKIDYSIDSSMSPLTATIRDIKEFGIGDRMRYIRAAVKIDMSSDNLSHLSFSKDPQWVEDTVFLKLLIAGEGSLYVWENKDIIRYFYQVGDQAIEQLIYKQYLIGNVQTAHNKTYLYQLGRDMNCSSGPGGEIQYNQTDLVRYVKAYNACRGADMINYSATKKKHMLRLRLMAGMNYSQLHVWNEAQPSLTFDYDGAVSFSGGAELESILPFNKGKWGLILEPSYYYYKSNALNEYNIKGTVNIQAIFVSVGVRYYIHLSPESKLHINPNVVYQFSLNSLVNTMDPENCLRFAAGAGYTFRDKYTLEVKYFLKADILTNYILYYSGFQHGSLIFRYAIH